MPVESIIQKPPKIIQTTIEQVELGLQKENDLLRSPDSYFFASKKTFEVKKAEAYEEIIKIISKTPELNSKLNQIELNKHNIELIKNFLKSVESNNSETKLKKLIQLINSVKNEHQTKLAGRIFQDENICNNEEIIKQAIYITNMTRTTEKAHIANKIFSSDKLYYNKNIINYAPKIIINTNTPEQLEIANRIISDERLYNNEFFMPYAGDFIASTNTHLKKQVGNLILDNTELYNNENIMNNAKNIIYQVNTPAQFQIVNKILSNNKLYNDEDVISQTWDILYNVSSKEKTALVLDLLNNEAIPKHDIINFIKKISKIDAIAISEITQKCNSRQDIPPQIRAYFILNTSGKNKKEILNAISDFDIKAKYPNLGHLLSKDQHTLNRLDRKLVLFPSTNRNIGEIPNIWLDKIPKQKAKETVIKLFKAIGKFAKVKTINPIETHKLEERLSEILSTKVSINYINKGKYGYGYKININNKDFFLKTFDRGTLLGAHGSNVEVQSGLYAKKHGRNNQFAKFIFGRLTGSIYDDGFMVNKYLKENDKLAPISKKDNPIVQSKPLFVDFISSDDAKGSHNIINGTITDYGAFVKENPELDDPKLRKNLRIITERFYKNTYKNGKTKYSISSSNLNFLNDYIQKNITEEELKAAMQILYKNQSNDGFYLIIETMEKLQSTLFKTTQQPQV